MSEHLTEREQEVLELLCQRLSDTEIAERLTISLRTAQSHVYHVLQKLEVHSRAEAKAACESTVGITDEIRDRVL